MSRDTRKAGADIRKGAGRFTRHVRPPACVPGLSTRYEYPFGFPAAGGGSMSQTLRRGPVSTLARLAVFGLLYFCGAELGHLLSFPPEGFAPFWPPSAVFLAAVLR